MIAARGDRPFVSLLCTARPRRFIQHLAVAAPDSGRQRGGGDSENWSWRQRSSSSLTSPRFQ